MNNLSKIMCLAFVGFILSVFNTACSDNEDEPNITDNPNRAVTDSLLYVQTIEKLTDYYVNEHGDSVRVVTVGGPLNPHDSTVFTVAVKDGQTARKKFLKLLPEGLAKNVSNTSGAIDLSFHKAHIRFEPDASGNYGTAFFDIPDLPELSQIEYISSDDMPLMGWYDWEAHTGQIWEDTTTGSAYLCVCDCDYSPVIYYMFIGIPVDFEKQESIDYNCQYWYGKGIPYYKNNAGSRTWETLDEVMKQYFDIVKNQYEALKELLKYEPTEGRELLRKFLRNVGREKISYESPKYYLIGKATDGSCFHSDGGMGPFWNNHGYGCHVYNCGIPYDTDVSTTSTIDFDYPSIPKRYNPSRDYRFLTSEMGRKIKSGEWKLLLDCPAVPNVWHDDDYDDD